jgi:hypothetical protein
MISVRTTRPEAVRVDRDAAAVQGVDRRAAAV